MSSGGFIDNMLNRIPGYGGYRDKERRRDSDRAIRDNLALEYGQLADQMGDMARGLAEERQILAVGVIDKPHKQLRSFIDRVRTASYGYAPLFSDAPVDARALDQLAAFDRALADQQAVLAGQIDALKRADPKGTEFKQLATAIERTIQGLDDRFDKRADVLTSGSALADQDVLALLEPATPATPPVAYRLHQGDALTYQDTNYTIVGRISAEADSVGWRAFQLKGGPAESWLIVSSVHAAPVHLGTRVETVVEPVTQAVQVAGETYTVVQTINGSGEVIGQGGNAPSQPVRLTLYRSTTGSTVLDVFDWGTSHLALSGVEVDAAEIDFFTREK